MDNQLDVVKPDGSARRRLADTGSIDMGHASFSPDSRSIVYHRRLIVGEEDARTAQFSLRTFNIDGTSDREILGETRAGSEPDSAIRTAPMGARWSPDGMHLAVVLFDHNRGNFAAIGGNWRLAIIDADGSNLRELKLEGVLNTALPWDGPEWRPVVAPDVSTRGPTSEPRAPE